MCKKEDLLNQWEASELLGISSRTLFRWYKAGKFPAPIKKNIRKALYKREWIEEFEIYCEGNSISQAVKHKEREIYGVLFHPEVRQKKMISSFVGL